MFPSSEPNLDIDVVREAPPLSMDVQAQSDLRGESARDTALCFPQEVLGRSRLPTNVLIVGQVATGPRGELAVIYELLQQPS